MAEALYTSAKNPMHSERAVIVLPEIFGMNTFIKATTDRFAEELGVKAFALDHFYPVTGTSQVYPYDSHDEPMKLMQQLSGQDFLDLFTTTLEQISQNNPEIKQFDVCGFCFGGKLAFLTGTDQRISRIVSFYGSRAIDPGFYQNKSAIQTLIDARSKDANLKVLGLFGESDPTIPAEARAETKRLLESARINYLEKVYQAGHAFMNFERENMYAAEASKQAWGDVMTFLQN